MEEKIYSLINRIRNTKAYKTVIAVLFPALIVFFAFCKVNKGLDITDSAYSCTNYLFLDKLDGMWFYSTFYANLIGALLTHLPYGTTFLGLNIYTGFFKLALGLAAYFFFTKEVKMEKEPVFLGIVVSVALSWCPTTILYNYLTYLFFFLGAMFEYIGLTRAKNRYLVLAGFMLGCNFFVRLPNVVEVALIIALWLYSAFEKEKFKVCLQKTGFCVAGYAVAFVPGAFLIKYTRGFSDYIRGIKELFAMTDEATTYSAMGMVLSVIMQYLQTWQYVEIAILCFLLCLLTFLVLPKKATWLRYLLATFETIAAFVLMYKKGIMDLNFHWFGTVYRYGAMILLFAIMWFAVVIVLRRTETKDKLLAALALLVIGITPLGSNNDIYANLNNMFFVLPVFFFFVVRFINTNEYFRGVRYSLLLFTLLWCLFSLKFGVTYIFRDGMDGPMDTKVETNIRMKGMKTTSENAKNLAELSEVWTKNNLSDGTVLLFGDVSGLAFYMDTPPAISTAWPTLQSFSADKFEKEIKNLDGMISEKGYKPPTIVADSYLDKSDVYESTKRKQEILNEFIEKYNYSELYSNEVLTVFTVEE